jgi:hypothetical protein
MTAQDSGLSRIHSGEVASPVVGHRFPGYMDYQGVGMRQQFPAERKWALGLQVQHFTCLVFYVETGFCNHLFYLASLIYSTITSNNLWLLMK